MTNSATKAIPRDLSTVFLDRDGVLNEKMPEGRYVESWNDFHVLPGVPEAIARLNRAGLRVVVVSNQRGIAIGLYTAADLEAIHSGFQGLLSEHGATDRRILHLPARDRRMRLPQAAYGTLRSGCRAIPFDLRGKQHHDRRLACGH